MFRPSLRGFEAQQGVKVHTMATYAKVRRMRLRDGLSISEIARRTSLSRNTIKRWLRDPARSEMKCRQPPRPKKVAGFEQWLRKALETDARRPRRERRTALKLWAQLKDQGFTGTSSCIWIS